MTAPPTRDELIAAVAVRAEAADRTESPADLEAAEAALQALLDRLAPDDVIRPRTQATLGSVWRRQWALGRRPNGLSEAITLLRAVVAEPARDRAMCLANLGNSLLTRGDEQDVDEVVDAFDEAVDLTPPAAPQRAPYLMNLGAALTARARVRPDSGDLDRGIAAIDAAFAAAQPDDPRRPAYQANLADALRTRFHRSFDRADIDRAVEAAHTAVAEQPSAVTLAVLGGTLLDRSAATGDDDELTEAIQVLAAALQGTPENHAFRARRMAGLAAGLRRRGEARSDPADLEGAEALLLAAARATPEHAILVNLSAVVIQRAQMTGDDVLLDRAIDIARRADRTNLATALHARASRTGDLADLDEAVQVAEEVVAGSVPGSREHVTALANLAAIRQTRHLRTGRGADLDAAVAVARAGVDGTAPGDPDLPGRLSNLGNALRLRGVRTRSPHDLDDAVQTLQRAVELAVTDRAGHLSNLGSALQSRAEIADGDPADAPPVLRAAVAAAPPGSPHLPRFLSNLGNALLNAGDPNGAVGLHREALALLPDRHPDRSVVLGNLAAALSSTADDAALPEVMRAAQEIRDDATASGQDRLVAAWRLADLEVRISGGDVGRAAPAMRAALDLAERAAWIGVTRADRTYTLARFSSLALDAAAAVAVADPGTAITILESGRGIGWRDQLQQRRFDALAEHSPALADRLRAIGTALDRPLVV